MQSYYRALHYTEQYDTKLTCSTIVKYHSAYVIFQMNEMVPIKCFMFLYDFVSFFTSMFLCLCFLLLRSSLTDPGGQLTVTIVTIVVLHCYRVTSDAPSQTLCTFGLLAQDSVNCCSCNLSVYVCNQFLCVCVFMEV